MRPKDVMVVGAGLAGSEVAWQLARRGVRVKLYEMRPEIKTPAHNTGLFAELVCSNSLRSAALENAVGLLKEEMRRLDSLIIKCADKTSVPAGGALAVDREAFAAMITEALESNSLVSVHRDEVREIPDHPVTIIATGPLTSDRMAGSIQELTGQEYLYFYDAVAPIIDIESVNMDRVFRSSRYDKGEGSYINCPMNQEEYDAFWEALANAERAPRKSFEKEINFEGCMPIEVLARRGRDTMRYGPLKPVGLVDPRTGKRPYAVVQLRQDNARATLFNLVGFQTHLTWGEQKRVLRMIPGLENVEIIRYGVMHRNTYINSPVLLRPTFHCPLRQGLFFAGQMTGVEGYVESAASGLLAGINAARLSMGLQEVDMPDVTAMGALANYITTARPGNFQPMNVNFGLFPPLEEKIRDRKLRNRAMAERSLESLARWMDMVC